ncbi:MAG TPA: FliA/WhiG family RNA polymerase sigma factor [Verrucomicrobiae bacterium]|nr:FliA/WhiG family RNA polymerase sigma factor [Verrucomicrobiae bacterium]
MKPAAKKIIDQQAWDEMVEAYLPLVRSVAEKVHRRLPPGVDLTSLIHSGIVGLLEALGRFDPERGVAFEVYARYRIEGEVMQCLRSLDWASRSVRAWGRKVEAARNRLAGHLSRVPNVEEMAVELNVPLEEYYRIEQKVSEAALLSLEDLSISSEAQWEKAQEEFSNYPFRDPLGFVEDKDLLEKLAAAVEQLPERERLVVTLYYHEELTLREIGEIMSLTEGRVCQIYSQAVGHLRDLLGEKQPVKKKAAADGAKPRMKKTVA